MTGGADCSVPNKDYKSVTHFIFPNNIGENADQKKRQRSRKAGFTLRTQIYGALVAIFAVEATGALAYRSHASARSILNHHLIRVVSLCKELYGDTKNYREISEKRRPVEAYDSFRISCDESYLGRDPSASLRLTNSGDGDCFFKRSVGKYYRICPCHRIDMIGLSTAAHETAKSFRIYNG